LGDFYDTAVTWEKLVERKKKLYDEAASKYGGL
jgi:hypothetical protein